MRERGLRCSDFRRRFVSKRLPDLRPLTLPDQHRAIVAAIWQVSMELADQVTSGAATPVLELAALLGSGSIPTAVFATASVVGYCAERSGGETDADATHDALRLLHQLSLAVVDESSATVRVHGLVQRVVREATPATDRAATATVAADALSEAWPKVGRQPEMVQMIRANVDALSTYAADHLWTSEGAHPVFTGVGCGLGEVGLVFAAAAYLEKLSTTADVRLGADHPFSLKARYDAAGWRGSAGDPAAAATALDSLAADSARVLGADDQRTLATRGATAQWRREAGDAATARLALQGLLADCVRVLGPDLRTR